MRIRVINVPFLPKMGMLKHPFSLFGKIALCVGAFLFFLGLALHILVGLPSDDPDMHRIFLYVLSLQGVIWGTLGLVFSIINHTIQQKSKTLTETGQRYEAEITSLIAVAGINIGHTPTVYAECIYINEQQQRCKVKSRMFLWENYSFEKLKAVVYTDWNDPSRYFVEITRRDDFVTDVDVDYT